MDFDDAYANMDHIPDAQTLVAKWPERAATFRASWSQKQLDIAYGKNPRQRFDLFLPDNLAGEVAKGLAVFIHGGYWRAFAKDDWSHLAAGLLEHGLAVALPSYRLAPEVPLDEICRDAGGRRVHLNIESIIFTAQFKKSIAK